MKRIIRWAFLGFVGLLYAEIPDLERFQEMFAGQMRELETLQTARVERLRSSYLAALLRLEQQSRQSGDLDGLLLIRNEIQRAEESGDLRSDISSHASLAELQRTLERNVQQEQTSHADRVQHLVERARSFSRQAMAEVLRAGDVDAAIAWRDWGDSLVTLLPPVIPENATRLSPEIIIQSARYGGRGRWMDVTEKVQEALDPASGLNIPQITNEWAGRDPAGGVRKSLEVTFQIREQSWVETAEERQPMIWSVEELHTRAREALAN